MSLLDPAGLAWLSLAPVVVLLYLMKLRRQEVRVSAGFLWREAAREARVDAFSKRLRTNLLLYLQLLALALLALALARPYLPMAGGSATEVAVLLDTSASMGARDGRFEEARRRALELVRQAPAGAEVMVGAWDRQARVLVPFTTDRSRAVKALEAVRPRDVPGDPQAGRALAASILASRPGAEAWLLGDRPPSGPSPARLHFEAFGRPAPNVALVGLRAAREPGGGFAVVAALKSCSDDPEQRFLEVRRGGQPVAGRRVALRPRGRAAVRFSLPAEGDPVLEAALTGAEDGLAADDRASLVLPREETVEARAVGPGNRFAEGALAAVPGVRLRRSDGPDGVPLVLWEGPAPAPLPEGTHVLLVPPAGAPVEGPFPLEAEDHPLLRDVPLEGLVVGAVAPLRLPAEAEVLARAGPHPALALVRQGGTTALWFGFDLYLSDLPLSPALPILLANLVEEALGSGSGPVPAEVAPGEPLPVRSAAAVEVTGPEGRTERVEGDSAYTATDRAGVYRVRQGSREWFVAANLASEAEADLSAPAVDATAAPAAEPEAAARAEQERMLELWGPVAALALALLLLEWFLYHRRRP